ncbi:UNVERIFIED_CONTAM: hypothetical protein Sindi_1313000 [Sesamum indicum]
MVEGRNLTWLDRTQSMMSFTELPPSFSGHALETTTNLLNMVPSKMVPQTPYEIWHGKPAPYNYLRVWVVPIHQDASRRQTKLEVWNAVFMVKDFSEDSRRDEVLLEQTSETPQQNEGTSFESIVPTDGAPGLCRLTRKSRPPDSVDPRSPSKGVKPVGCKWVYKHKLGADGKAITFKARLMEKEYTQRSGVDFKDTYSLVAMAKSI